MWSFFFFFNKLGYHSLLCGKGRGGSGQCTGLLSTSMQTGLSLPAPTLLRSSPGWAALSSSIQECTVTHEATLAPAAATQPASLCPERNPPSLRLCLAIRNRSTEPSSAAWPWVRAGSWSPGQPALHLCGERKAGQPGLCKQIPGWNVQNVHRGCAGQAGSWGPGKSLPAHGQQVPGQKAFPKRSSCSLLLRLCLPSHSETQKSSDTSVDSTVNCLMILR